MLQAANGFLNKTRQPPRGWGLVWRVHVRVGHPTPGTGRSCSRCAGLLAACCLSARRRLGRCTPSMCVSVCMHACARVCARLSFMLHVRP